MYKNNRKIKICKFNRKKSRSSLEVKALSCLLNANLSSIECISFIDFDQRDMLSTRERNLEFAYLIASLFTCRSLSRRIHSGGSSKLIRTKSTTGSGCLTVVMSARVSSSSSLTTHKIPLAPARRVASRRPSINTLVYAFQVQRTRGQ